MTLLEVEELTRYWINYPPLHLTVAAYLGVGESGKRTRSGPLAPAPPAKGENADIASVLAELGSSFAGKDVHVGLAPAVLDFTELKRRVRRPADA
jgi:hypothetical protein